MTAELRELLELAARAAGYTLDKSETNGGGVGNNGFDFLGNAVLDWHNNVTWNPLTSGDDLIDLMVRRSMAITWLDSFDEVICWILHGVGNENVTATEKTSNHPNRKAALSMAVVRCAAEWQRRRG